MPGVVAEVADLFNSWLKSARLESVEWPLGSAGDAALLPLLSFTWMVILFAL